MTAPERSELGARHDGRFMEGRDGWLFLARDSNGLLEQHTGERRLPAAAVRRWIDEQERRTERMAALGAAYACLVPPNPHAVYAEFLPPDVPTSSSRPVRQLIREHRRRQSASTFLYPLGRLRRARRRMATYPQTDSHWNDYGAYIGYEELCRHLAARDVTLRRLRFRDIGWEHVEEVGDLGDKVDPPRSALTWHATLPHAPAVLSDNGVRNTGRVIEYACADAPGRCVLFGDSFSYVMVKFLAVSFGRLTLAHTPGVVDDAFVRERSPDVVLTVINERFLMRVPDDANTSGVADWYSRKLKHGRVLPPERAAAHKARDLRPDAA